MVKRRTKGEIFIAGFAMFSLSSYFLSYYLPRISEFLFILGAIFLLTAELSIKGRIRAGKVIVFIVLLVIGLYMIYISAMDFITVMQESTQNYILSIIYIIGWILMLLSSGILKLSKII